MTLEKQITGAYWQTRTVPITYWYNNTTEQQVARHPIDSAQCVCSVLSIVRIPMLSWHRLPRVKGILTTCTMWKEREYRGIPTPLKYGGIRTIHICLPPYVQLRGSWRCTPMHRSAARGEAHEERRSSISYHFT